MLLFQKKVNRCSTLQNLAEILKGKPKTTKKQFIHVIYTIKHKKHRNNMNFSIKTVYGLEKCLAPKGWLFTIPWTKKFRTNLVINSLRSWNNTGSIECV